MDKKYLKQRRRGWYVRVRVPKSLEQVIGKSEIIRTLHTRSIDEARSLRWAAIKEIKEYLDSLKEAQEKGGWNSPQDIVQGARLSLGAIQTGQRSRKEEVSHFDAALNAFEEDHFPDDPETQEPSTPEEYRPAISLAHSIIGGTSGKMVGECLMDHLAEIEKRVRLQTVNARKRRINVFIHWLKYDREISAVTRSEAGEYVTVLMKQDRSLKTIKDTVSDLSAFFNWCLKRGFIEVNPFHGMTGTIRDTTRGTKEKKEAKRRPWERTEIETLLHEIKARKGADSPMWALTVIALYTGMRINEIAETILADTHQHHIHVPEGKTESSVRDIPIHPVIRPPLIAMEG